MDAAEPRTISIFSPSAPQWHAHQHRKRFNLLVCHRGWGKSFLAVNELLYDAFQKPNGRYAYIGPFRNQAKQNVWTDVLKRTLEPVQGTEFNESDLRAVLPNRASVQLFGADNEQALRGMHLDGVVLDEYAQIAPHVWHEVVRPAIERKGGFAIFIGTPRGKNHFWDQYQFAKQHPEDWYVDEWPASRCGTECNDRGSFDPEHLARIKEEQGPDFYAQEYECSWEAAIKGAYYARQIEEARLNGRIRHVPWEPAIQVDTWWDLGWSDATAIIFGQRVGREIHLIDYVESYGRSLPEYARELAQRPYLYGTHFLPHDAGHHELGSGKTLEEQLRLLNLKHIHVLAPNEALDGINQARLIFNRVWFDELRCARLIDMLGRYTAKWDPLKGDFGDKPVHDIASHAADAFRYMAVSLNDVKGPPEQTRLKGRTAFSPYTYTERRRPFAPSRREFNPFGSVR